MEALKKTLRQFRDLYDAMSPSQRGTLIVVPLMVVGAFAFLMLSSGGSSYVPLSWGKVYTTEELIRAEQTLMDAGLVDFRREGRRLLVPASEVDRYNAALVDGGGLPTYWAEELEESLSTGGLFTTRAQIEARMDAILGKELRRVLRALPDIEDASVKWARSKPGRWPNNATRVTALVTVRPRPGRELSRSRIESLRYAAASMVPDLKPENVTVLNQTTGEAYTAETDGGPFDSGLLQKIRDYEREYEEKIRAVLSYIPGVLVSVNVDPEKLERYRETRRTVEPKPVAVQQQEERMTTSNSEQPTQAEPGPQANTPRQLPVQPGRQRTEQITESSTQTVSLPSITVTEKDYLAAMPESVQVAVSIPVAYAQTVALESKQSAAPQGDDSQADVTVSDAEIAAAEADIKQKVQSQVSRLIPNGSPSEAVDVSFHVPGKPQVEPFEPGFLEQAGELAARWGGALGLVLFAIWALWMLNKSLAASPPAEESEPPEPLPAVPPSDDGESDALQEEEEPLPPAPSKRDKVQAIVRDNPEMAAAVLSKWMQSAN